MTLADGIGVAVPTFIDDLGVVDENAHTRLARLLVATGARRLLVAGTTGQGSSLGRMQRAALVRSSAQAGIPVWCGIHPKWVKGEMAALREEGAAGVLVGWEAGSELAEVLAAHDQAVECDMQLVAYHHPREGHHIDPAWYDTLAAHGIIAKNSSNDAVTVAAMAQAGLRVHVGATSIISQAAALGAAGVLSGLATIRLGDVTLAAAGDCSAHERLIEWEAAHSTNRIGSILRDSRQMLNETAD